MKRMLLLLLLPSEAWAIDDVWMLGNSYIFTHNLDTALAQVFEAAGSEPTIRTLTAGGLTLADHAERAADPESEWYEALVTQADELQWVVLQDQSQIPGFPQHSSYWQDSMAGADSLNALIAAAEAETVFFLTWGRREGDSTNASLYPDFETMQERLTDGYLAYQEATSSKKRPTWIAPVGPAFARVHADILEAGEDPLDPESLFWGLYNPDASHPSPTGTYLAACVFYATLTGSSPVGLDGPGAMESEIALELQEAAATTVFEDTDWLSYPWQGDEKPGDTGLPGDTDGGGSDSEPSGSDTSLDTEPEDTASPGCGCSTGLGAVGGLGLVFFGILASGIRRR